MTSKIKNFLITFLEKAHLGNKKILTTYIYALLVIPLFFGFSIGFTISFTNQNIVTFLKLTPLVAIDTIIAITDFIMGYYLFLKKDLLLNHLENYRFLMLSQAFSQLLVGNIFCLILAIFGVISINGKENKLKCNSNYIKIPSAVFIMIFLFCSALTINLLIRK